jgi:peptidase E
MRIKFGKAIHTSKLLLTSEITESQIETHLSAQDVIFVGGGNIEQMLTIWKHKGFISILNKFKNENKLPLLMGVSAGGMYPFNSGLSDSKAGQYQPLACLDWLKQSFCPHADSKVKAVCAYDNNKHLERIDAYKSAITGGQLPPGYAVPDNCMLHFYNFSLVRALTAIKNNNCFYVSVDKIKSMETLFLTKYNTNKIANEALTNLGLSYL